MNLPVILGAARRFGGLAVSSGFGFGFRIACCGMGKNSDLCKPGKNSVLCNLGRVRELDKCVGSTAVAEHLDAFGTLVRDGYEPRTATWAGRVMVELKSNFEQAVQEFLAVVDKKENHPVLVHCYAGIHRTGTMCAIFRMEYHGWTSQRAIAEMQYYGFAPEDMHQHIAGYLREYKPRGKK